MRSVAMAQVTGAVTGTNEGTCYKTTFEGGPPTQINPENDGLVSNTPIRFPLSDAWITRRFDNG